MIGLDDFFVDFVGIFFGFDFLDDFLTIFGGAFLEVELEGILRTVFDELTFFGDLEEDFVFIDGFFLEVGFLVGIFVGDFFFPLDFVFGFLEVFDLTDIFLTGDFLVLETGFLLAGGLALVFVFDFGFDVVVLLTALLACFVFITVLVTLAFGSLAGFSLILSIAQEASSFT
ncbi:MAG: hypothetical protein ACTSR1_10720, partial [Candidatus Heimdallarchaeota archaeon]